MIKIMSAGEDLKKIQFVNTMLKKNECASQNHYNILNKNMYDILLKEVIESKNSRTMSTRNIRRVKRFDIIEENGIQKLVQKIKIGEQIKYFLTIDDIYDEIVHLDRVLKHNSRDRLLYEVKQFCANVTKDMVIEYTKNCDECQFLKLKKNKALVKKPLLQTSIQRTSSLEIIEKKIDQLNIDEKYLMIHEDCNTKFIILRALQTDDLAEICTHLVEIFSLFGPPSSLQGKRSKDIVDHLSNIWPEMSLVHDEITIIVSRYDEIEVLIRNWLEENPTKNWTHSLPFIQYSKNIQNNPSLKNSPFKAMFSHESHLSNSRLHSDSNVIIKTESRFDENALDLADEKSQSDSENKIDENIMIKSEPIMDEDLLNCQCVKKCGNNSCICVQRDQNCTEKCHNSELCRNK